MKQIFSYEKSSRKKTTKKWDESDSVSKKSMLEEISSS